MLHLKRNRWDSNPQRMSQRSRFPGGFLIQPDRFRDPTCRLLGMERPFVSTLVLEHQHCLDFRVIHELDIP